MIDRSKSAIFLILTASFLTPLGWLASGGGVGLAAVPSPKPRGADYSRLTFDRFVDGELKIVASGQTIVRTAVTGGADPVNGRGITVAGADPKTPVENTVIRDCRVQAHGDDGISIWGHTRRTRIENCLFTDIQAGTGARARQTKAALFGNNPADPPIFDLQWISVTDSTFAGFARVPDIRGGVVRFLRVRFMPSARTVWTEARANIAQCDFYTSGKPADATWWDEGRPIVLKDPPPDSIYVDVKTCTLNGRPIASASDLFRLYRIDPATPGTVGNKDVPASVFRKKPWPTR